ncbi:kynurenine formamidase-like [Glandiceps talaboti]
MEGMSHEELDLQFSSSKWSTRMSADVIIDDHLQKAREVSKKARLVYDNEANVPYIDDVFLDIFKPEDVTPDAPVFIFIHGGFWQLEIKDDGGYCAMPLVKNGIITVSAGYTIAPKGTLNQMVEEIKQAVVFIANKYPQSRGIFIGGHSAGAHLSAMMMSVDWTTHNLPKDILKGVVLLSGVFDICPIVHTYVNDPLKLTEDEAKRLSPTTYIQETCQLSKHCKVLVVFADEDTPAFRKQSKEYGQQLRDGGLSVKELDVKGHDHFDLLHDFQNDDYIATQELLKLLKGGDQ